MRKKLFFVMLVLGLATSHSLAVSIPPEDPLPSDISPAGVYSHADNGEIWTDSHLRMIDGSLTTNWGFSPANATDPAIEIVFDFGEQKAIGAFKWWNRATSGNLFADNIDLYKFTNDDPTDTPILLDMDLATDLRQPGHPRGNNDIYSEVIDITDFYGRYVKLVFDDGPQSGGNIQGAEIAFRIPEPATIVLLALGGLALIRKR